MMQWGRGNTHKTFKMEELLFLFEPGKQSYLVGQQKNRKRVSDFFQLPEQERDSVVRILHC